MNKILIILLITFPLKSMEKKEDPKPVSPPQIVINIDDHRHKHKTESPSETDCKESDEVKSCCASKKVQIALLSTLSSIVTAVVTAFIVKKDC